MANLRSKTWTFILYPESLPENWQEILEDSQYQIAISPLHDSDVYSHDIKDKDGNITASRGDIKKAHYHIILKSSSSLSYGVVARLSHDALCGTIPMVVYNNVSLFNYLTHDNDDNKSRYDKSDIALLNNFDLSTKEDSILTILAIIKQHGLYDYSELIDYLADAHIDLLNYAVSNSYPIIRYMNGKQSRTIRIACSELEFVDAFNMQQVEAVERIANACEPPLTSSDIYWITNFIND